MSSGKCIFCQDRDGVTHDHVPPKLIFPKPRPVNLVTVPACKECNQSFSKDDEYFRVYLSVRKAGEDHKHHKELLETSIRSLERSPGFKEYWESRLRVVERVRIDGTLDYVVQFQPDDIRIERIGERIVRGLYYHHHGNPLATDSSFCVWFDHGFDESKGIHYDRVSELLKDTEVIQIGTGFSYQYAVTDEDDTVSIWRLQFLDKIWGTITTNVPET